MNPEQKEALHKKLRTMPAEEHIEQDLTKWLETLESNDEKKALVLKRMLLLLRSCDLQISEDGKNFINASENDLPLGIYLAGHLGRIYMSLPEGCNGEDVLKWIDGGNLGTNVYPRFAATHAAEVNQDRDVVEKKLNPPKAFFGGLYSAAAGLFGAPRKHYGMDVALGEKNKRYKNSTEDDGEVGIIKDDGTSGHVYFNLNKGRNGDSLGFGFEGTAPSKSGFLGAHSFFGAADDFTPFEGEKFATKLTSKYLNEYLDVFFLKEEKPKPEKPLLSFFRRIFAANTVYEATSTNEDNSKKLALTHRQKEAKRKLAGHADYSNSIFKPFFKNKKLSTKELESCCRSLGIKLTSNNTQILTPFAKSLSDSGVALPCNYNGAKLKIDNEKIQALFKLTPDEIETLLSKIIEHPPSNSLEGLKQKGEFKEYGNEANQPEVKLLSALDINSRIQNTETEQDEESKSSKQVFHKPSSSPSLLETGSLKVAEENYRTIKCGPSGVWRSTDFMVNCSNKELEKVLNDEKRTKDFAISGLVTIIDWITLSFQNDEQYKNLNLQMGDVIKLIDYAKANGGVSNILNKATSKYEKNPNIDKWESRFSVLFEKFCREFGFMSDLETDLPVKLTLLPPDVLESLVSRGSDYNPKDDENLQSRFNILVSNAGAKILPRKQGSHVDKLTNNKKNDVITNTEKLFI